MNLRPYQTRAVEQLRKAYVDGHGGALLELGTGAGKTVTAVAVCAGVVAAGGRVVWLAHRRELVAQAEACMRSAGLGPALPSRLVYCATVQSRLPVDLPEPTVLVIDEGHRALSSSYRAVIVRWPNAFRVLLTGTAWRSDGASFEQVAPVVVKGPTVGELQAEGWLVPCSYWSVPGADLSGLRKSGGDFRAADVAAALDRPGLVGDVAATYVRLAQHRFGVVFAAGVDHAHHLTAELRRQGVHAAALSGETSKATRAELLAGHGAGFGGPSVLVCADLLLEGWDNPVVSAVVFARATASNIVWRQGIGRGLRLSPGKDDCLVIDHGGNCGRLGLVDEPLDYDATTGRARARCEGIGLLTCEQCFAVLPSTPRPVTCPRCFAVLPRPAVRGMDGGRAGDLVPFEASGAKRKPMDWQLWRRIEAERTARGYRPGWTWAQYGFRSQVWHG